jgi:hypothetical protein
VHGSIVEKIPRFGDFGSTRAIDLSPNLDLTKPRRLDGVFYCPVSGSPKEMNND